MVIFDPKPPEIPIKGNRRSPEYRTLFPKGLDLFLSCEIELNGAPRKDELRGVD